VGGALGRGCPRAGTNRAGDGAAVGSVVGLDLTPTMIDRAHADAAGVENVSFELGEATALDLPDDSLDGAITRFSLHHIPAPVRVLEEMRRVVRPGGHVVVANFVTDEDATGAAWQEQIEHLRDPSHWALLTPSRIAALADRVGLEPDLDRVVPFEIDYDEWLNRDSGGPANAELIERLLGEKPATAGSLNVSEGAMAGCSPIATPSSAGACPDRGAV
jgi:SAM-dependent methyltransferase